MGNIMVKGSKTLKIKILSSEWEIIEIEPNAQQLYVNNRKCIGTTVYFPNKIYLDRDLSPCNKRNTLIHELAHAYLHETQIDYKQKFDEEMLCEFMGKYADIITGIADQYFKINK